MDPRTTWQRFRALPTWLQVAAWVLAWPALGALAIWRLDPGRPVARAGAAAVLLGGGVLWLSGFTGAVSGGPVVADVEEGDDPAAVDPSPDAMGPSPSGTDESLTPDPTGSATPSAAPSPPAPSPDPGPSPTRSPTPDPTPSPAAAWTVTNVVDGDTIDVDGPGSTEERIRVIGIDTPERGECGFAQAADALASLVLGREVDLVPGAVDDRDRYGRLLRYVDVDGTDAGLALIQEGLAIARYDSRDGYGRHPREDSYVASDTATDHLCTVPLPSPTAAPALPPPADTPDGPAVTNPWDSASCHPAYDPCVPPPSEVGDLNCPDIRAAYPAGVSVDHAHGDPHRLDGDSDGHGCE